MGKSKYVKEGDVCIVDLAKLKARMGNYWHDEVEEVVKLGGGKVVVDFSDSKTTTVRPYNKSNGISVPIPSDFLICVSRNSSSEMNKVAGAILKIAKVILSEDVEKFDNWGWINDRKGNDIRRFRQQENRHYDEMKKNPSEHRVLNNVRTPRGHEHFRCSCGFEYQIDSGG